MTKKPISLQRLWTVALVLLLIGLATSIPTLRRARQAKATLERQQGHIERLLALQQDNARIREYRNVFERLPVKRPVPIATLAENTAPPNAKIRMTDPAPIPTSGWTLIRANIEFGGQTANIGDVLNWAASVEARSRNADAHAPAPNRPPWRLAQATIHASPPTPGLGDVFLAFEALEKNEE